MHHGLFGGRAVLFIQVDPCVKSKVLILNQLGKKNNLTGMVRKMFNHMINYSQPGKRKTLYRSEFKEAFGGRFFYYRNGRGCGFIEP